MIPRVPSSDGRPVKRPRPCDQSHREAAIASTHRPVASREGFNQSWIVWVRGNSSPQRHTGRTRSSRHGNLDVVMAVFPSPFVVRG